MKLTKIQAIDKGLTKWRKLAETGSNDDHEACALCNYALDHGGGCQFCPAFGLWGYKEERLDNCWQYDNWLSARTKWGRKKWSSEIVRVLELAKKRINK